MLAAIQIDTLQAVGLLFTAAVAAYVRIVLLRGRARVGEATGDLKSAEAKLKDQDYYQELIGDWRARLDDYRAETQAQIRDLRADLQASRQDAAIARSGQLEAAASLAEAQAEIARLIARAADERHGLKNEIANRDIQIQLLGREVDELRAEVAAFKADLGKSRRHSDDHPPTS